MVDQSTTAKMERVFQGLADRTRLRLLNLMRESEVCVCYFVEVLDLPQPTISRHLAYLRRAGLVSARREGKWMHYRIAFPECECTRKLLNVTLRCLAEDKGMQRDLQRLGRACCAPQKFVTLQHAPTPSRVEQ
ncbi:MAG TPA: metalloregulator ArsR/SmtB family transcription factor [candidate division Zixibacteria bacterium]|nr:metalloregulator ArsR/SmtB family transcription factor [candidate division Zixibacteria bacterium]